MRVRVPGVSTSCLAPNPTSSRTRLRIPDSQQGQQLPERKRCRLLGKNIYSLCLTLLPPLSYGARCWGFLLVRRPLQSSCGMAARHLLAPENRRQEVLLYWLLIATSSGSYSTIFKHILYPLQIIDRSIFLFLF